MSGQSPSAPGVYSVFDPVLNQQFAHPEWVRLIDIVVPQEYQRLFEESHTNAIVEDFFAPKVHLPRLIRRDDGALVAWDGQHTLAALKQLGYEYAWCAVSTGLSRAEEARLFAEQHDGELKIAPSGKTFALAAAASMGDTGEDAMMSAGILAVLQGTGWRLNRTKGRGKIDCSEHMTVLTTTGLVAVYKAYGLAHLQDTLNLINEIWGPTAKTPGNAKATQPRFLEAVAHLLKEYPKEIDLRPEIKARLRSYPIEYVEEKAAGMANQSSKSMAMAEFLRGNVLADYKLIKRGKFRRTGKRPK